MFRERISRLLSVLLVFVCLVTLLPQTARAAEPVDVFYQKDKINDNKVVAVQVSYSGNLSNCETCVNRLREAGYNAWLYQAKGSNGYAVLVGIFSKAADAEKLAVEMHTAPAIKGVKMEKAYATNAYISDEGMDIYSYPFYGGKIPVTGIVSKDKDTADVFYGTKGSKTVAVQVASSSSIANCKTCVRRLREAGYNAWLYQAKENGSYQLLIGAFSSKAEASDLINELKHAPAIKGVKLSSAFATTAYISSEGLRIYSNPYYGGVTVENNAPTERSDKYLVDCKVLSSSDDGGSDIMIDTWKDNFGNSYKKSMKFWVRDGGGYIDTESIAYRVSDGYVSLTGWIVASDKNESKAKSTVNIYVDGSHVYQSPLMGSNSDPVWYEVVLGGVGGKITVECTTDSNAFGHCIVSGVLHPDTDEQSDVVQELPPAEKPPVSTQEKYWLEGTGALVSWSGSRVTVEHWMPEDEDTFIRSGEVTYSIAGADIYYAREWGDDTHFTSMNAALKHKIDGMGCNIVEATDGVLPIMFWHDGESIYQISFLYVD